MLSEQALIRKILAPLTRGSAGALGLRDDAATLSVGQGQDLVVTMDTLIEDRHFRSSDPPDLIARKALRVNLSDLAAKGARPIAYFLSLGIPDRIGEDWLSAFAEGLSQDQSTFGIVLHGGDTVRVPERTALTVTAIGEVPRGRMVRRDGARPGDRIYVSGSIGDGALGLDIGTRSVLGGLDAAHRAHLSDRFLLPRPRLELVDALREHASAAMDISDGLVGDADLLCSASGVTASISGEAVPLSDAARCATEADADLFETVLTGGDDYEILCTVPGSSRDAFETAAERSGTRVTDIGEIREGEGRPRVMRSDGREMRLERLSYSHF